MFACVYVALRWTIIVKRKRRRSYFSFTFQFCSNYVGLTLLLSLTPNRHNQCADDRWVWAQVQRVANHLGLTSPSSHQLMKPNRGTVSRDWADNLAHVLPCHLACPMSIQPMLVCLSVEWFPPVTSQPWHWDFDGRLIKKRKSQKLQLVSVLISK